MRKKEKHSRKKSTTKYIIFDGKNIREYVIYSECSWIREEPLDSYLYLYCLWNHKCRSIESKKTRTRGMSWVKYWIYPELDLERNSRYNSGRLWRGQQAEKTWLDIHCYNLAKQLSYYLYFFSFTYIEGSMGKCYITNS